VARVAPVHSPAVLHTRRVEQATVELEKSLTSQELQLITLAAVVVEFMDKALTAESRELEG
jgi:PIN domain nuclease of toxin-antitoxin system